MKAEQAVADFYETRWIRRKLVGTIALAYFGFLMILKFCLATSWLLCGVLLALMVFHLFLIARRVLGKRTDSTVTSAPSIATPKTKDGLQDHAVAPSTC